VQGDQFSTQFGSGYSIAATGNRVALGSARQLSILDLERRSVISLGLEQPDFDLDAERRMAYFHGTLALSPDARFIYSTGGQELLIVDLQKLEEINAILESGGNVRQQLCALGVGRLFRGRNVPGEACPGDQQR
jgi:hypothetical protein